MSKCFLEPIIKDLKCSNYDTQIDILNKISRQIEISNELNIQNIIKSIIDIHNVNCVDLYRVSYNQILNAYDIHLAGDWIATVGIKERIEELKGELETTFIIDYFVKSGDIKILNGIKNEKIKWQKVKD